MNATIESFHALREDQPRLRARDAARHLGITEAELLDSGSLGKVLRLQPDFKGLLEALPALGEVKVICRNDAAVHETVGPFTTPHFPQGSALIHGGPIDLRLFLGSWRFAFALLDETKKGVRRSLQIFDRYGVATMKVYLGEGAGSEAVQAFEALVDSFATGDQAPLDPETRQAPSPANDAVDVNALREAWTAMQDTHEFYPMLRRLGLERTRALQAVGSEYAMPLRNDVAGTLLNRVAAEALPIMVFVGNPGAINIFTGKVERIVPLESWLNVMDPGFNLHLDTRLVHSAWRVRKPTRDGVVTSIELFDEAGECIALFFGERKPGREELAAWRELVAELEVSHA